jgi:hypothetical protein
VTKNAETAGDKYKTRAKIGLSPAIAASDTPCCDSASRGAHPSLVLTFGHPRFFEPRYRAVKST